MQISAQARKTVLGKIRDRGKWCRRLVPGETDMKIQRFALFPLILAVTVTSLVLAGCNTTAGLGRDVAAGGNAVTESAQKNKGY
jgi:predicted small secreted protein